MISERLAEIREEVTEQPALYFQAAGSDEEVLDLLSHITAQAAEIERLRGIITECIDPDLDDAAIRRAEAAELDDTGG